MQLWIPTPSSRLTRLSVLHEVLADLLLIPPVQLHQAARPVLAESALETSFASAYRIIGVGIRHSIENILLGGTTALHDDTAAVRQQLLLLHCLRCYHCLSDLFVKACVIAKPPGLHLRKVPVVGLNVCH